MRFRRSHGILLAVLLASGRLLAGYQFEFVCRDDTARNVEPGGVAEFGFTLTNTGTEPDVYELGSRAIQIVPDWTVVHCVRGRCGEPGVLMFDTLEAGANDTSITLSVFTTSTHGEGIVAMRVRSLGEPSLVESIATRTVVSSGVEESRQDAAGSARPIACVARGSLRVTSAGDLFDVEGRKVAVLLPGSNCIGHLRAGAYLFRLHGSSRSPAWKVVVQ